MAEAPAEKAKPKRVAAPGKKLGRPCTICTHPQRPEIDQAIVTGDIAGDIAARFGLGAQAVAAHRQRHVPTAAMREGAKAVQAAEAAHGGTLIQSATALRDKALALLDRAEKEGDIQTALRGVREAIHCVTVMAKLTGEIDDSVHLSVTLAPVLISLQTEIIQALAPYPEARASVIRALAGIGGPPILEHEGNAA